MIKLILGFAIVAFGGFLGYFLSKKYRKRKDFFCQMSLFNERFLMEIGYYRRPLTKFLTAYPYKGEFDFLLQYFYQSLIDSSKERGGFELKKEEVGILTADELAFVKDYFQTLGRGNSSSQKSYFSTAKTQVDTYREKSETECKRYGDLYIKLGILMGIAVLIFIV